MLRKLNEPDRPMSLVGAIRLSLKMLQNGRRRLVLLSILQVAMSVLDLVGVALFGVLGVLSAAALSNGRPPTWFVNVLSLDASSFREASPVLMIVGGLALGLLIAKSLGSLFISKLTFATLARQQVAVSQRLARAVFAAPVQVVDTIPSQQIAFALTAGTVQATTILLGLTSMVVADVAVLIVLGVALVVLDPLVTAVLTSGMVLIGLALHRGVSKRSALIGEHLAQASHIATARIQDGLQALRELRILQREPYVIRQIMESITMGANAHGSMLLISQTSKTVFEAAVPVGAVLLALWALSSQNPEAALGTILIFLAAASRILPSMQRLNANLTQMRNAAAQGSVAYKLLSMLGEDTRLAGEILRDTLTVCSSEEPKVKTDLVIRNVSFTYPGRTTPAVAHFSLNLDAGCSLALVGRSGAGKSTLADLIAGVLDPDGGEILIGGSQPSTLVRQHPGAIGFLPQTVAITTGTLRENVAFALDPELVNDEQVWRALEAAQLSEFAATAPGRLDAHVGERGVLMSGGQRQRLGLARALYSNPRLLVLDEATSALDAETEHAIGESLRSMTNGITLIVIAHRLATVRQCDLVGYLEDGALRHAGTFDELMAEIPDFAMQARLHGL